MIPVRCFTCGKIVGNLGKYFIQLRRKGMTPKQALDACKLKRFCCRRMILSHIHHST